MRKTMRKIVISLISLTVIFCCIISVLAIHNNSATENSVNNDETATNKISNDTTLSTAEENIVTVEEEPETTEVANLPEANLVSKEYEVQSLASLNVRDDASTDSKIIGVIDIQETLPYIENANGWYKIVYNGIVAYVSANSKYSRLKSINSTDTVAIENIIEVGMNLLGTPYEYGSIRIIDYNFDKIASFTGNTFDCSAFVQYCFYIGANVNLYGDSRSMSKQGTTVNFSDLKRGDVIFMTSTSRQYNTGIERIGHVAIYLGDNQLLHTYGEGGVRVTDFSSFWQGRFITAKRML